MKSLQYINSIIASKKDIGLLVFRILIGLAFIWHGVPKLLSGPEGWTALGSMMGALGIHLFPTFFGLLSGIAETDIRRTLHPARPVLPPDGPFPRRQSHDGDFHRARLRRTALTGLASV